MNSEFFSAASKTVYRVHGIILNMLLRIYKAFRDKRKLYKDAGMPQQSSKHIQIGKAFEYPRMGDGREFNLRPLPSDITGAKRPVYLQVWAFLSQLEIVPLEGNGVELLAKFEWDGGRVDPIVPNCRRGIGPNLRSIFLTFKRIIKHIRMLCLDGSDFMCFSPCTVRSRRLLPLGFNMHTPAVSFLPCWRGDTASQIFLFLLEQGVDVTKNIMQQVESQLLFFKPCIMSLRGIPRWRKRLIARPFIGNGIDKYNRDERMHVQLPRPRWFPIQCTTCKHWRDVHNICLLRQGKWTQLRCDVCDNSSVSSKWLCMCGSRWHNCSTHSALGNRCARTNPHAFRGSEVAAS